MATCLISRQWCKMLDMVLSLKLDCRLFSTIPTCTHVCQSTVDSCTCKGTLRICFGFFWYLPMIKFRLNSASGDNYITRKTIQLLHILYLFIYLFIFFFFCDLTNRRVSSQHTVVPKLTIRILAPLSIVDYIPYNFITYVHVFYNEMCFQLYLW